MLYFDLLLIKCYAVGFEFVKNLYDSDLLKFLCFQSISFLVFELTRLSHLFNFVLVYLTFDFTFLIPFSCFLKKTLQQDDQVLCNLLKYYGHEKLLSFKNQLFFMYSFFSAVIMSQVAHLYQEFSFYYIFKQLKIDKILEILNVSQPNDLIFHAPKT